MIIWLTSPIYTWAVFSLVLSIIFVAGLLRINFDWARNGPIGILTATVIFLPWLILMLAGGIYYRVYDWAYPDCKRCWRKFGECECKNNLE